MIAVCCIPTRGTRGQKVDRVRNFDDRNHLRTLPQGCDLLITADPETTATDGWSHTLAKRRETKHDRYHVLLSKVPPPQTEGAQLHASMKEPVCRFPLPLLVTYRKASAEGFTAREVRRYQRPARMARCCVLALVFSALKVGPPQPVYRIAATIGLDLRQCIPLSRFAIRYAGMIPFLPGPDRQSRSKDDEAAEKLRHLKEAFAELEANPNKRVDLSEGKCNRCGGEIVNRISLNPFASGRTFTFWMRGGALLFVSVLMIRENERWGIPIAILVIVCAPYYLMRQVCRSCGRISGNSLSRERAKDAEEKTWRDRFELINRFFNH